MHRHSGSPSIRVSLSSKVAHDIQRLVTVIEDISESSQSDEASTVRIRTPGRLYGMGMSEMRARARRIGGRIHVEGEIGRTVVTLLLPIAAETNLQGRPEEHTQDIR